MTIRTKLLLSFGVMMAAVLAIGVSAIWSIIGWGKATGELSSIYNKSMLAERLRANVYQQVEYGEDFLEGQGDTESDFQAIQEVTASLLADLKANIKRRTEADHIKGLEETDFELVWIANGLFRRSRNDSLEFDHQAARERLQEIADEITDDIAALNQYYRSRENESIQAAARAGNIASVIIAIGGLIALLQLLAMVFLLRRWFVKPITVIGVATREISAGNLGNQITMGQSDEWGQLASDINQMARSLKASQQRLVTQERLAALGEIASYTAHNLRNPLAGIRAAAQVSLGEQSALNDDTRNTLKDIIESVDRLDLWIKRFLAFAKPLKLSLEPIDVNELVGQVVSLAQKPYADSNIKLCWSLASDLPRVSADPALLEQAIFALASNAFEATPPGNSITIKTSCAPIDNGNKWVTIGIIDGGNGIAPQIRSRLFQPFVTSKDGGTGLGLAQAKKIVDLHGGEISLNDGPEKGTAAVVRLPLHAGSAIP